MVGKDCGWVGWWWLGIGEWEGLSLVRIIVVGEDCGKAGLWLVRIVIGQD